MQHAVPAGRRRNGGSAGLGDGCRGRALRRCGLRRVVSPANFNGAGQVVIAGARSAVERAMALAKERGAKEYWICPSSAPFHCQLMQPAAEGLERTLHDVAVQPFDIGVITNAEADVNRSAERVKALLIEQAVRPVRWEESVKKLVALELPSGH